MVTMTPDLLRHLRRIGLFAGFGLLVFVVALYMSFPYERAKEAAIRMASKNLDMDVEIGSAGPAFGWRSCSGTSACARGPPTGKPTRFTIDSAKFSPSILALFTSSFPFTLTMDALGGKIELDQSGTPGKKGGFRTELSAHDIDMAEIPGVKEAINMPLTGKLKLELELASETGRYADANGFMTITCAECVAGDGKTPLKVAGNAFLSGGLTLPRTRIGDLGGRVAVEKGTAKLQGVESKSPGRRGGAGGRDQPPRSAVVVDREPLPSFQAVRRVPPEGEQRPDDPERGGRGGEAPRRLLRPSHRRAPRPDDAARADADLAGGEQRGARVRGNTPRGAIAPAAPSAAVPPPPPPAARPVARHAGGAGAAAAAAAPAAARGGAAPAPSPPPAGGAGAGWKGAPPAPPPAPKPRPPRPPPPPMHRRRLLPPHPPRSSRPPSRPRATGQRP